MWRWIGTGKQVPEAPVGMEVMLCFAPMNVLPPLLLTALILNRQSLLQVRLWPEEMPAKLPKSFSSSRQHPLRCPKPAPLSQLSASLKLCTYLAGCEESRLSSSWLFDLRINTADTWAGGHQLAEQPRAQVPSAADVPARGPPCHTI